MTTRTGELLKNVRRQEALTQAQKYPYKHYTLEGGNRLFVLEDDRWLNVDFNDDLITILGMKTGDICFLPNYRGFKMAGIKSSEGVAEFSTFQTQLSQLTPTEVTPE